jgi:hypothetical protein
VPLTRVAEADVHASFSRFGNQGRNRSATPSVAADTGWISDVVAQNLLEIVHLLWGETVAVHLEQLFLVPTMASGVPLPPFLRVSLSTPKPCVLNWPLSRMIVLVNFSLVGLSLTPTDVSDN